jgi:molybdate transport system substrate-binding protein
MISFLRIAVLVVVSALAPLAGCSRQVPATANGQGAVAEERMTLTTLIVSVAASTTDVVEELCKGYGTDDGVEVKLNAGPSNGLATQILEGAPADLFLSASKEWADKIEEAGLAVARVDLLTNRLVVVVPKGNPANVHRPEDLSSDAVKKLALAGESVPAGVYAGQALSKLGVLDGLVDAGKIVRGQDVRAALSYVSRGEAEAGIVYATDVHAAKNVEIAFEFDPELHEQIVYVLVLLKHAGRNEFAHALYSHLQTTAADEVYSKFGFIPLPPNEGE